MTYKKNTAEGGTDTVTASAANTGGSSGDAASAFPGSVAPTFSATQKQAGSLSYKFTAASGSSCIWQWTGFNGTEAHVRASMFFTAAPSATTEIIHVRTSSVAQVRTLITSGLKLQMNHQVSGTSTALGTNFASALSANTWYDHVVRVKTGSTGVGDGQISAAYALSSTPTTYIETLTSTTSNTGTANFTDYRIGKLTSTTWSSDWYIDNLQGSDVTTGTFLGTIATTPPTAADTAGDYYVVDLSSSTAGSSGTLAFSTAKVSGQTLTYVQVGAIFYFTKSASGTGTYRFTVTESPSGQTNTIDVTIPQSPGTTTVNKTAPAAPNHAAPSNVWT